MQPDRSWVDAGHATALAQQETPLLFSQSVIMEICKKKGTVPFSGSIAIA